jgi:hypothetical protein
MKINTKKIGVILKALDGADYIYLEHCMNMRKGINNLIKRHNLSKNDVCERFKITPKNYEDFIKGNYNYSINDIACLNASFVELESIKLKEEVPVQIAKP